MPARVTVRVHESFEGAIGLEMREPTAFRPQVVSYADVYAAPVAEGAEVEDGVELGVGNEHGELFELEGVPGNGTCDAREDPQPAALKRPDEWWSCVECACVRRVDVDPRAGDGRVVAGGMSWGAKRVSDEELGRRGKIIVRTVDSPITLIV